ncbi:MAG: family 1 glycosylhydrolase, partial [Fibrobacter sp.]|nr:family 1 glycosylhydrolase [Fibrobacter sp.]
MSDFLRFPKNFLWGAATASYQIEGGAYEDGRTESIWDRFARLPGRVRNGATGDVACDHYHLWKSDLELMASLGLKAYRYSISWSRVLPEGRGKPNQKGLDFYSRLTDGLLEKGIEPFITLFHWDLPMVIQDAGGWLNRRTIDWFVEYAELMYKTLGDRVKLWATLNEPNAFVYCGFVLGKHAPGVCDDVTAAQVSHHLLIAHGDAVKAGRSILSHARFGFIPAIGMVYPADDTADNQTCVEYVWRRDTGAWLDPVFKGVYPATRIPESDYPVILPGDMERIAEPLDFLGINHYSSTWFSMGSDGEPMQVQMNLPQT